MKFSALFFLIILLHLPCHTAIAKIYRWQDQNGQPHYTNSPPPEQNSVTYKKYSWMQIKKPVDNPVSNHRTHFPRLALTTDSKATEPQGININLTGHWCEYASSLSKTGNKTKLGPVEWEFTKRGSVNRTNHKNGITESGQFTLNTGVLTVNNNAIAKQIVLERNILDLVLLTNHRYHHWRRGSCQFPSDNTEQVSAIKKHNPQKKGDEYE